MVLITNIIQNDDRLNWTEKALLSFYRYWTVKGDLHKCCKHDECVIEELKLTRPTFYRMKKHLKELGLIYCNENGETIYTGDDDEYQNETVKYQNETMEYQNETHK